MFNSGCCGCRYGEQSAGREGGRRKDQEGGLAGSERVAAVRRPAGLRGNCVRRERTAHGGRGLPDVLHWGMSCCSTEMQETSEGRRLGRRPGSVVFLTLYILMCDTHTGECTDCDRTA